MYVIEKGCTLLCHKWDDPYQIPENFYKTNLKDWFTVAADKLLLDPHKKVRGWTERARKKSIAGKLFGHWHPVFSDEFEEHAAKIKYLENNYFIFEKEIEEGVDIFMVHKKHVREKNEDN